MAEPNPPPPQPSAADQAAGANDIHDFFKQLQAGGAGDAKSQDMAFEGLLDTFKDPEFVQFLKLLSSKEAAKPNNNTTNAPANNVEVEKQNMDDMDDDDILDAVDEGTKTTLNKENPVGDMKISNDLENLTKALKKIDDDNKATKEKHPYGEPSVKEHQDMMESLEKSLNDHPNFQNVMDQLEQTVE